MRISLFIIKTPALYPLANTVHQKVVIAATVPYVGIGIVISLIAVSQPLNRDQMAIIRNPAAGEPLQFLNLDIVVDINIHPIYKCR